MKMNNNDREIAIFEKVSFDEYLDKVKMLNPVTDVEVARKQYEDIKLPERATKGSAGYDFFAPFDFTIPVFSSRQDYNALAEAKTIPTGIRCNFREDYALFLIPKSGLGFKYATLLANTVGLVDSDYYYSSNEGHIMAKMICFNDSQTHVKQGKAFMQGVFLPFGITVNDKTNGVRNGGFGSTGR